MYPVLFLILSHAAMAQSAERWILPSLKFNEIVNVYSGKRIIIKDASYVKGAPVILTEQFLPSEDDHVFEVIRDLGPWFNIYVLHSGMYLTEEFLGIYEGTRIIQDKQDPNKRQAFRFWPVGGMAYAGFIISKNSELVFTFDDKSGSIILDDERKHDSRQYWTFGIRVEMSIENGMVLQEKLNKPIPAYELLFVDKNDYKGEGWQMIPYANDENCYYIKLPYSELFLTQQEEGLTLKSFEKYSSEQIFQILESDDNSGVIILSRNGKYSFNIVPEGNKYIIIKESLKSDKKTAWSIKPFE